MARLDPATERVVIRLVYDGPAWAGKTTTLRSLARSLGSEIRSGEEADGRTLQFDWVDYVGGLFRGRPIQCQIVGVPGQRVLEARRLAILGEADAVVFVADSRAVQSSENQRSWIGLRQALAGRDPAVATVVQANKRDLPGALALDALRLELAGSEAVAMTESVAEDGEGVRETFVLAVRLALDRVRSLWDGDGLPRAVLPDEDAARLLAELDQAPGSEAGGRAAEKPDMAGPPPQGPPGPGAGGRLAPRPARGPRMPDDAIPPGLVWPPVNGRVFVHEAWRQRPELERSSCGDWIGRAADWLVVSPAEALFVDFEVGRLTLIEWAQWHVAAGARLSNPRALALVEAAPGAWRLWQILKRSPTLADRLEDLVRSGDRRAGARLLELFKVRLRAEKELVDGGFLPHLSLGEVALTEPGDPVFAGAATFPPPPGAADKRKPKREVESEDYASGSDLEPRLVESELVPALAELLRPTPARLAAVLASLERAGEASECLGDRRRATLLRTALLRA